MLEFDLPIGALQEENMAENQAENQAENLIQDVSDTAFWVAHYRGRESQRKDALFRDPLAERLAGEQGSKIAASMPHSRMTQWNVVMRTCIIDDLIRASLAQGVDTIVNLGAGLDTRPYRLELPDSLHWIEADYPHVIDYKEQKLAGEQPHCRLERVRADLADADARRALLERIDAQGDKILILTEGVVVYLSLADAGALADDLRRMQHISGWIIDYFSPTAIAYREREGLDARMENAPFKFKPTDWFGFFAERGWQPKFKRFFADEAERRGRPMPVPRWLTLLVRITSAFAPKERIKAHREFAGYFLLEPVDKPAKR